MEAATHPIPSQLSWGMAAFDPWLPILLKALLGNEAWKIPVDLQATNWKLYFNR